MNFRFQEDYEKLSEQCPPKHYEAKNIEKVFRWTFGDINDERNFQSQYHKNPRRYQTKSDLDKCEGIALSMFDNLKGAKDRFSDLKDDMGEKIYQTLGSNIAEGSIEITCGVNGPISKIGHFNHHPSTNCDYTIIFKILTEETL